ncbi:MAG: peptidylprolyl isomerase [Acidobacteria bacterium]|nr:peptidylprolyl isomerase [Acidobacteriota bacterium]
MHRLTRVVSAILLAALLNLALPAGLGQSQPGRPAQEPETGKAQRPGGSGGTGQETDQALPFEDPNKAKPDAPPALDTDYLAKLDRKTVIGEVNGQPVTVEDLNRLIDFADQKLKPDLSGDAAKRQLLDNYLENRAFYFEALAEKMDQDPDLAGRLDLFRQQLFANAYLGRERRKVSVSEDDMRKYYDAYRKEFEIPEIINASHILVRTEQEALAVKKQLDAGADFAQLAREKSIDTTNKHLGGNLGFIARGAMLPPFDDAAFKLKAGQISDPVQTTFGYHVIKVLEARPRRVQSFDEAKKVIEARVMSLKQNEWLKNKRDGLRSKYGVRIHEKYFAAPTSTSGALAEPSPADPGAGQQPSEAAKPGPSDRY